MNSLLFLFIIFVFLVFFALCRDITLETVEISGPGLNPDVIVMPARYFFVFFRGKDYSGYDDVNDTDVKVVIRGKTQDNRPCRIWTNVLYRKDSSIIVRYKLYEVCYDFQINVLYKSKHVAGSPFFNQGPILPDDCPCPDEDMETWLYKYGCEGSYKQMQLDLGKFQNVNFDLFYHKAIERFNNSYSSSVCHYVVQSNEIYRNCYGQYVGFKMFTDSILLSLSRKVKLPDLEFFMNLGDWPLMKMSESDLFPIFSWCGSIETADIIMPSYDLTESSLECMGRVSLDMLSVQGNIDKKWQEKEEKVLWRGRDSNKERLKLIEIARAHPDLFNASITNFFFFKDKKSIYGPKESKRISFFKFFDYKYQLNMDGTVAAFRLPYLLAGNSVVLKQSSNYFEHFYKELKPWVHYIPFKSDLSDLVERVKWAKDNDDKAREIGRAGQRFAKDNLLPQNIICYNAELLYEWSKKLKSKVLIRDGMEHVKQIDTPSGCICHEHIKDEL